MEKRHNNVKPRKNLFKGQTTLQNYEVLDINNSKEKWLIAKVKVYDKVPMYYMGLFVGLDINRAIKNIVARGISMPETQYKKFKQI